MIKNHLTVAFRHLDRHKGYTIINIGGLAAGMSVFILIALWVYDELSYNNVHPTYDRLARVMQHQTFNGEVSSDITVPIHMAQELRDSYGSDFKYVSQASWDGSYLLTVGEKQFIESGQFFEPQIVDMLGLTMVSGVSTGLTDPYSIMLNESVARAFFGSAEEALHKSIRFINQFDLKVAGVYEDIPFNSSFKHLSVILPWELYLTSNPWIKGIEDPWGSNFTHAFVVLNDNADFEDVSGKIRKAKLNKVNEEEKKFNAEIFLHPMSRWHLYSDFKNGINTGGRIEYVWLFGVIGIFVLLLACINFMNLNTARSERRAKEVGIRKAIGSARAQLIRQFFSESFLVSLLAFFAAIIIVSLALPLFNQVADKRIDLPWLSPTFWLAGFVILLITTFLAGSYPAFYLSSFQSSKALRGTFRTSRFAVLPRKVLVVVQFTVSVTLVIATMVVYQQIGFAKDRPLGYDQDGLIHITLEEEVHKHFEAIRHELKADRFIEEMAAARSPLTEVSSSNSAFDWQGKDPQLPVEFPNNSVTHEFGKTVGWTIVAGRDFSRDFATDTAAFIVNESAAKVMGMEDPVGKILRWKGQPFTIIGVVKDMLQESPYQPVRPSLFHLATSQESIVIIRLNRERSPHESLAGIESLFKKYSPDVPFLYNFVDEDYGRKFGNEERVGTLAAGFAAFAIFISCLGLFGLASFVAEQRTKEIGIRKVVGATIFSLWKLLSVDFAVLVLIACAIAVPISYFFANDWLQRYDYRVGISWQVFAISIAGATLVTLLTVSHQTIRIALSNPVKSLRIE